MSAPSAPGWLPRLVLAVAVLGVVALTVLPWPGPVAGLLVIGAAGVVVAAPGGYATGALVLGVGLATLAGPATIDVRLAASAALLPVVHVSSALAGAVPFSARVDRSALTPSALRVLVAAAVGVALTGAAAATPVARGAGPALAAVAVAIAAIVLAAVVVTRGRPDPD